MTTVGEILKNARIKKNLELIVVEKATRIRLKFLLALENDDFEKLPPGTFAKGFIKNYAGFLNLPIEETLAFYRRQVNEEKIAVLPAKRPKIGRFSLTPQFFTAVGIGTLLLIFFSYLLFSYFQFAGSPTLIINSPENNSIAKDDWIEVVGKTDPQADLTINNQPVTINETGSFDVKIPVQPGLNTLTIVSTNKFKRQTVVTRNLRLERWYTGFMIDATQFLLGFVILAVVAMLTVICVQVYFILREFRKTLTKANKVLDDTGVISESVSKPVSLLSAVVTGMKLLTKKKKTKDN